MAKKNKSLSSAPELPEENIAPVETDEDVIELDEKIEGPIDDKLADLLEEATEDSIPKDDKKDDKADAVASDQEGLVEDAKIDEAIEEIAAAENSEGGLENDERHAAGHTPKIKKPSKPPGKFRKFIAAIWADPRKRWIVLGSVLFIILALALIPYSRYFILNTARIRSSLSLKVVDSTTMQPLKNVAVRAGGAEALTDSDGVAQLKGVKLGSTQLKLEKRAFATIEKKITVGWGSNPLGDFSAQAVGTQYTFYVRDAFSDKPITDAEAASGEGNAHADEEGKMVLVMDTAQTADDAQLSIVISAKGYRNETLNITVNNKETQEVNMVPDRRHVFVSKRSGNYDVYAVDADGKNEQRIVGGTGLERADITLIPHPTENVAAFVSTRENTRNSSGYLLSTLYVLNTASGDLVKIDQSEQIKVIGWTDNSRLVYVKIAAGASGTDPKRHRLMSFNNKDYADVKELASSNTFNDVVMAGGRVYYAPSNIFQEASPALYAINPDGNNRQTILDKEVYMIVRTSYDKLFVSTGNDWYEHSIGSPEASSAQAPSSQTSRVYADMPGSPFSLWVDERDGKGVLIRYDKSTGEEKVLAESGGLKLPVYWLNDTYVIYRIADSKETADYALNIDGGAARKIVDVTDTSGMGRWIYY